MAIVGVCKEMAIDDIDDIDGWIGVELNYDADAG